MPDVEDRLLGVGGPALPLRRRQLIEAVVVGEREILEEVADVEIRVAGDRGRAAAGDRRLVLGHELIDLRDRVRQVPKLSRQPVREDHVLGGVAVRRIAGEQRVGAGREDASRRREYGRRPACSRRSEMNGRIVGSW